MSTITPARSSASIQRACLVASFQTRPDTIVVTPSMAFKACVFERLGTDDTRLSARQTTSTIFLSANSDNPCAASAASTQSKRASAFSTSRSE